jgi:putative membrane protein
MSEGSSSIETLRVHQANERTMLAWIRTGIALMGFGFAIARFGVFLREVAAVGQIHAPSSTVRSEWVGAALVALGMVTNMLATVRYARVRAGILRGQLGAPNAALVYGVGIAATLIGAAMTALLARVLGEG